MKIKVAPLLFMMFFVPFAWAAQMPKPTESYEHYLKALVAESQGNMALAVGELEQAIELSPTSATLYRTMAEMAFRQGQFMKAAQAIEETLALEPDKARHYLLAGQIYWSLGDADKAEEKLAQAVKLAPDEADALVSLAMAVTPKDPKRAIKLYEDFLVRHPAEQELQERVAQLYQAQGDAVKSKEAWLTCLDLSPSSIRAHLALAQIAEVEHDTATAISHYEDVLTHDPSNLPLLLRVGELQYRNDSMDEASRAFSKAQALAPESPSANFWLALMAEHHGDWKEAIRLLKRVVAQAEEPGILLRLSYYYAQSGHQKDAIAILKKLSDGEPENTDFLNYLTVAYEQDKQFPKAEASLQKLIDIDFSNPEHYFHLATLYDRMKKFPKTEEALKKAISLAPDYHVALNYLGYSYAERNIKLEEAETLLNTAIALSPDNSAYLDSMGWVYFRQGKFSKAEDFLKLAATEANDPLVWSHLADVYLGQGKFSDAIFSLDESLRLDPKQPALSAKIRQTIKRLPADGKKNLFLKRTARDFSDLKSVKGLVRVSVCETKPCFESKARFNYEVGEELRVEIPGPLAGPVMLLVKAHGQPATYGAIHPLLQSVEPYVNKAFERMAGVLEGAVFKAENSTGPEISFDPLSGRLKEIKWRDNGGSDVLRLTPGKKTESFFPARFEWQDLKTNFKITVEFLSPVLSLISSQSKSE